MALLKFSFIICALFVLQAHAFPQQGVADGGLVDFVKQIVSAAEGTIDTLLVLGETAFNRLTELINDLNGKQVKIINDVVDAIGNVTEAELSELSKVVNDDAKAIIKCVDANKDVWRTSLKGLIQSISTCSTSDIKPLLAIVKTIIVDIQALQADVKATASKGIDGCDGKSDVEAVGCLVNVLREVVDTVINIPDALYNDFMKFEESIRKNFDNLTKCPGQSFQDFFPDEIVKFVNAVATCARKS